MSFPADAKADDAARKPKRGYQPLHPEPEPKRHHPPKRREDREIHRGGQASPDRPMGRAGEGKAKPGADAISGAVMAALGAGQPHPVQPAQAWPAGAMAFAPPAPGVPPQADAA